jgi:hypothetical protein
MGKGKKPKKGRGAQGSVAMNGGAGVANGNKNGAVLTNGGIQPPAHNGYGTVKRFFLGGDDVFTSNGALLAVVVLAIIYMSDKYWTKIDEFAFFGFVLTVMTSRLVTDCSSMGERICYVLFLLVICVFAYIQNLVADHDCTFCMASFPNQVKQFVLPGPEQQFNDIWALFDESTDTPRQCASCVLSVSGFLVKYVNWFPNLVKGLHEDLFASFDDFAAVVSALRQDPDEEVSSYPKIEDPLAISPAEARGLDEWYLSVQEETAPKSTFSRLIRALAADDGDVKRREKVAHMMHDLLCYPRARSSGPKPSEYLFKLKTPLFTGEENKPGDGPMKIDFEMLVSIMRGDMLKHLRPDVCAMLRLVDQAIQIDETVLTLSMNAATVALIANETALKGQDVSFLFPGLYVMKVDEDRDPNGSAAGMTEALISVFTRIPMIDDAKYFSTREEYIAFFRWHIEHKVQDEYYFPQWLSRIEDMKEFEGSENVKVLEENIGELLATQFRYRGDRQRIFDSTSDSTLGDRAFYGAGVKTLTAVVLPQDPSYGYLLDPEYYDTAAEKEFFKNKAMPTELELLGMVTLAWGKAVDDISLLRDRVVQVDYTLASHWKYRDAFEQNGSILYLDAESRKPIGIWLSYQENLILPNSGGIWEHAKYIHRSTEISVAAMM